MNLKELTAISLRGNAIPFAGSLSTDNLISVITDSEVHVLKLKPHAFSNDRSVNLFRNIIKTPVKYPTKNVAENLKTILENADRFSVYNILNDSVLSPDGTEVDCNDPIVRCVQCCWSPEGCVPLKRCALAMLGSSGNVDIIVPHIHEWNVAVDLSQLYRQTVEPTWKEINSFTELKQRAYSLYTTCISWSSYNDNKASYIAMGQCDGSIVLWKVTNSSSVISSQSIELLKFYPTKLNRLTFLTWTRISNKTAIVIVGSLNGIIKGIIFNNYKQKDMKISEEIYWAENDDIRVDHIVVSDCKKNRSYILTVKRSFIVVNLITSTGQLIDTKFYRAGNISITGVQETGMGRFVITCMTGYMGLLKITVIADKLHLKMEEIQISLAWSNNSLNGVCSSYNRVMWFLILNYCKTVDHLILRESSQLIICSNSEYPAEKILTENPTKKLTRYWDCLEVCRLLAEKKNFKTPFVGTLDKYDHTTAYKMKIFFWMNSSCEQFYRKKKMPSHLELLTPFKHLETLVFARHCIDRLKSLCHRNDNMIISNFERNSVRYLISFLNEFKKSDLHELYFRVSTNVIETVLKKAEAIQLVEPEKCLICQEDVLSDKCVNGHFTERCTVSLVPIEAVRYPTCEFCASPAHPELLTEPPLCSFCDIIMDLSCYNLEPEL